MKSNKLLIIDLKKNLDLEKLTRTIISNYLLVQSNLKIQIKF